MNQLSPEARRLLKLAQSDDVPDPVVQRRVERSLGRRVALGAAITTGGALIAKTASGARVLALMAKIAGIGGVVTVVGAGYVATRSADEVEESARPAPASPGQSKGSAPGGAVTAEPAAPPAQ